MDKVRIWGAVETEGAVRCEIRDVENPGNDALIGTPDFRVFRLAAWEHGDPPGRDLVPCGCKLQLPCGDCHARAAKWWPVWEERRQSRQVALFNGRQ